MSLLALPNETITTIYIQFLGVVDIIKLERVCARLWRLSNDRHLWLELLRDLDIDHAPDISPSIDLDSLSAQELKNIVVKAVQGFINWNRPGGPIYSYKIDLSNELLYSINDSRVKSVKLVPGGRHLVAYRAHGGIECWDVLSKSLLAAYQPRLDDSLLHLTEAFEVDVSVDRLRLFIFATTPLMMSQDTSALDTSLDPLFYLFVIEIELRSGVVTERFRETFSRKHFSNMIINGDFIGLITGEKLNHDHLFLYNWRTRQKVIIKRRESCWAVKIIEDYLIIISEHFYISSPPRFYSISALGFFRLFESGVMHAEFELNELLSDVNRVKVIAPLYYTTIPKPRGLHVRNELLTAFSISYTHWKRQSDRKIFVRILTSGQYTAQVVTVQLPMTISGEKIPLQPNLSVYESPEVRTDGSVPGLVSISSWEKCVSMAGRAYLVNRRPKRMRLWIDQEEELDSDKHPGSDRAIWFSSLWAFSNQKNYDWMEEGSGTSSGRNSIPLEEHHTCNRIPLPDIDISRSIAIDYQSGAVYFPTNSYCDSRATVMAGITIWYPS